MTNSSGTLYTGVTNNIIRRVYEHKAKLTEGFTKKYNINKLIYLEVTNDVYAALNREKQIKGWGRKKKLDMIAVMNPHWDDLSKDWFDKDFKIENY
jgi:putative endonuclease